MGSAERSVRAMDESHDALRDPTVIAHAEAGPHLECENVPRSMGKTDNPNGVGRGTRAPLILDVSEFQDLSDEDVPTEP